MFKSFEITIFFRVILWAFNSKWQQFIGLWLTCLQPTELLILTYLFGILSSEHYVLNLNFILVLAKKYIQILQNEKSKHNLSFLPDTPPSRIIFWGTNVYKKSTWAGLYSEMVLAVWSIVNFPSFCIKVTFIYISLWQHCRFFFFFSLLLNSRNLYVLHTFFTSRPFLKTAGGIVLGSVAVSAVSADVLPYISVAIKASFLKLGMCNICKNNIAKMFLDFFKILNCSFDRRF